ncbi:MULTISPECIES: hypothetical protein [unclassified Bradyrhizobium]|uniref:hypothetical protein n=1 Tax=unclassified Bradyrhizobium TaxID=2631580 RepID=UPI002916E13E|nr:MULTISPECIES: hypothetical protein [unclassified Bradyrhizobium]
MSSHKPKFKNISADTTDWLIKHHLPYELWMMRESLAAARRGAPTRVQQNWQVEGFGLHSRNLIEFLKNGESCGFNPADFTTNAFSVNKRFLRSTLLDMINQQISHLTTGRTENPSCKFDEADWIETANAIEKEFKRWIDNLSPEWFEKWEQRERMGEQDTQDGLMEHRVGPASTTGTPSKVHRTDFAAVKKNDSA